MLKRLTLREIRGSLGRFLAIAAIIALGVGLFSGLRISTDAMLVTGEQYLQDLHFFDFRLLSTLGFTDADVEAFGALDGISAAEGAITQDVYCTNSEGSDMVIAMHTLSDRLNLVDLRAGRLPESKNECVLDASNFGPEVIGTQLPISPSNDPDTLDLFACQEFTVVGLVDSPLYINYERGSTSLGSGTVFSFAYVLPAAFDVDYYTDLYVTLEETAPIYSDEYQAIVDAWEPVMESQLQQRADIRYQDLRTEAEDELEEARQELADGRQELADARQEYADGKAEADQELADAWQELLDARQELDDGWLELDDARATLAQETADAEAELADGEKELEDALAELEDGEQEYADAGKELEDGEADYADGLREYRSGLAEFEDGKIRYEQGVSDYEDGLEQYEEGLQDYSDGMSAYRSGMAQYEAFLATYEENRAIFDSMVPDIEPVRQAVEANREQGEAAETLFQMILAQLPDAGISTREELIAALQADPAGPLAETVNAILAGMSAVDPAAPANVTALLALAEMLEPYWQAVEVLNNYEQLESTRIMLAQTKSELDSARLQLSNAAAILNDTRIQLEDAEKELEESRQELDDGWLELEDGRIELEKARQELDDGWQEYNDGLQELADGRQELAEETAKANQEIADAEQDLRDGEQEYADGLVEYEDGKREAEEELADAAQEIADGEQELLDGEQELRDGEQELEDLKPADCYTLDRETNVGYVCFENDTSIVAGVSGVFPLFFFLVAALVCITTMTRMVEDERTKIGVLKALGYSSSVIMAKYLFYSGSASLIGCAIGFVAGSKVFPMVLWKVYDIMYSFSYPIVFLLDWKLAAFSIGLYLLCALGSTWLVCRASLREVAAELIRPKAPKSGKRILLERIPFLWRRFSFLYKVSARNVFRYKKRLFMMVVGIGGCTALLVTGFGIQDSIANVADVQFGEISRYDISVTFQDPMDASAQQAFDEACSQWISDDVFFYGSTVDATNGTTTKSANLVVCGDEMTGFMDFHCGDSPVSYPGPGEVLINNGLAEVLQLDIGDTLTLQDSDMRVMEATVSGIYDNHIYNYVFLTPETYESQLGFAPEIKSAYVTTQEDTTPHAAGAALIDLDSVLSVSINEDMHTRVNSMLSSLNYIVLMVIICAGCLAFIVLYNLTNINIMERIREIATIKVLGFYAGETAAYVFRESAVLTAIGAAAGIPLGKLLHAFIMSRIRVDMMHFDVRIDWSSYAISFLLTFVFAAIVSFAMSFKLKQIKMAESLKSIE